MVIEAEDLKEEGLRSTCTVCLGDFTEGEEVKQVPCGGSHYFHAYCIGQWLELHYTCPNCREDLWLW